MAGCNGKSANLQIDVEMYEVKIVVSKGLCYHYFLQSKPV